MSLIPYTKITLDEVLCFLMARTNAPSTMGAQLEQAKSVYHSARLPKGQPNEMHVKAPVQDIFLAQERAEQSILENISIARCVDALARVQVARVLKDRPTLDKLQKACPERGQGELVIQCLRAYETWRLKSPEKALAAVYEWAQTIAPLQYPVALPEDQDSLAQAFREGAAKRARTKASQLYGDSYLVGAEWVAQWNVRRMGPVVDSIGRKRRVVE